MRPKRLRQPAAPTERTLSMTPMIDVTFLLLVFFMCTLQFKTLEGKLAAHLPKDVGPTTATYDHDLPIDVHVVVAEAGAKLGPTGAPYTAADAEAGRRFDFDATREIVYRVGPRTLRDRAALIDQVARLAERSTSPEIVLHIGSGVAQGDVVHVLDAILDAGVQDVRFAGRNRR